jgi:hypothetical protein
VGILGEGNAEPVPLTALWLEGRMFREGVRESGWRICWEDDWRISPGGTRGDGGTELRSGMVAG